MKERIPLYSLSKPNYEFIDVLGSGSFGTVFKVYDKDSKRFLAVKRSMKIGKTISREYEILKEVNDLRYCIKYHDIFYTVTKSNQIIQNIIFDYIPENLLKITRTRYKLNDSLTSKEITKIMYQLLKGIEQIHNRNIIHRDIKPENLLIDPGNFELKICDFGSAKKTGDSKDIPYIVSRYYRAPELILANASYGKPIDIWAAGCILIELYTGTPVFLGSSDGDQLFKILGVLGPIDKSNPIIRNSQIKQSLLSEILNIGEKTELKRYFESKPKPEVVANLAENMLRYDPKERFTASQCLKHSFFDAFHEIIN